MIYLPKTKRWTGDGFGDTYARVFTQVKINDKAAIYARTVDKTGVKEGYEVFMIKERHKGDPLPGGTFEPEDRQVYPSGSSFGRTAWATMTLERAEEIFKELTEKTSLSKPEPEPDPEPEPNIPSVTVTQVISSPANEFTTKEYAAANKVSDSKAYFIIQDAIKDGSMIYVREERRNGSKKPTKIYAKV